MRSIPVSVPLPRIRRNIKRLRPQSLGFVRRSAVKVKIKVSRSANMGRGGMAVRGFRDILRRVMALAHKGATGLGACLSILLACVAQGLAFMARPAVKSAKSVCVIAALGAEKAREFVVWHNDRRHSRTAPMFCMLAFTCLLFAIGHFGLALEVRLNGQPIGFVNSRDEVSQLILEVESRAGEYMGAPQVLNPDISYSLRLMQPGNLLDTETLKSVLFSTVNGSEGGVYLLRVGGKVIGGSESRTQLENLLSRVKSVLSAGFENMKTEFVQDIAIEASGNAGLLQLATLTEMEAMLISNSMEMQVYTVSNGDTVSAVAKRYGMSVNEIRRMNPELNIDKISIGDEIMISAAVPYLSLRQMRTESYRQDIPFDTIVEYSDSMYVNQSKITTAGVPGLAAVVADVSYVDGLEEGRNILQYTVLSEPSSQVKLVGTKALPAKAASGKFIKPSNGKFSSGYGYRKSLRDNHTGVDFSGKVGTSIWAADGGTVTFAGWKGNYGYCVIINHGNGFETLYAHCSSLLVKNGQKVAKQEAIAKVGNTGRSTGPHVHFEIIKNGKHVNPLNYINK